MTTTRPARGDTRHEDEMRTDGPTNTHKGKTLSEYRDDFRNALSDHQVIRVVNMRWTNVNEWYQMAFVLTCTYLGKDFRECYEGIIEVMPSTLMLASITFTDIGARFTTVHVILEERPNVFPRDTAALRDDAAVTP